MECTSLYTREYNWYAGECEHASSAGEVSNGSQRYHYKSRTSFHRSQGVRHHLCHIGSKVVAIKVVRRIDPSIGTMFPRNYVEHSNHHHPNSYQKFWTQSPCFLMPPTQPSFLFRLLNDCIELHPRALRPHRAIRRLEGICLQSQAAKLLYYWYRRSNDRHTNDETFSGALRSHLTERNIESSGKVGDDGLSCLFEIDENGVGMKSRCGKEYWCLSGLMTNWGVSAWFRQCQ